MKRFKTVTLETSPKPFMDLSDAGIRRTCEHLVEVWRRLIDRADVIQIMWWVSDGNEVYEWHGNWDEELIWSSYIGFCNFDTPGMFDQSNRHYRINKAVPYRDTIQTLTFGKLKQIFDTLRDVLTTTFNKPVRFGATIDPGPEFAPCRFKIQKHPEVLTPNHHEKAPAMMHFMTHQAMMNPDDVAYAAFPSGINENTSFPFFLGAQFNHLAEAIGYDYIWFSNGFAYSHFPWGFHGECFDGHRFYPDNVAQERALMERFWVDFRKGCPDKEIQVRGTNFTVGMDIASDGADHNVPLNVGNIPSPPCNPPWGSRALGMEMASYLSRISKQTTQDIQFRFYLNDVWFNTNAWYDYYNRETFDIYTPMSASRLNGDGSLSVPNRLAILTVDTEKGEYLMDEANEVTPHFNRALDEQADAVSPFTWVYPYDEYHTHLSDNKAHLGDSFFHDQFMVQSLNAGLPVSTVASTDAFVKLHSDNNLPDTIFITPVPHAHTDMDTALVAAIAAGAKVILYGSLADASEALRSLLGVTLDSPLSGEFELTSELSEDNFAGPIPADGASDPLLASIGLDDADKATILAPEDRTLHHRDWISGGGISERAESPLAEVRQGKNTRAYAIKRDIQGTPLVWLRGTAHVDPTVKVLEINEDQPHRNRVTHIWLRRALSYFGWDIIQDRAHEAAKPTYLFLKRRLGSFWFVGNKPNTTTHVRIKTPYGAPVFNGFETRIEKGYACEDFGRSINSEVSCFVEQGDSLVYYTELAVPIGLQRYYSVSGLQNATVRVFAPLKNITQGDVVVHNIMNGDHALTSNVPFRVEGDHIIVEHFTGALYVGFKK